MVKPALAATRLHLGRASTSPLHSARGLEPYLLCRVGSGVRNGVVPRGLRLSPPEGHIPHQHEVPQARPQHIRKEAGNQRSRRARQEGRGSTRIRGRPRDVLRPWPSWQKGAPLFPTPPEHTRPRRSKLSRDEALLVWILHVPALRLSVLRLCAWAGFRDPPHDRDRLPSQAIQRPRGQEALRGEAAQVTSVTGLEQVTCGTPHPIYPNQHTLIPKP